MLKLITGRKKVKHINAGVLTNIIFLLLIILILSGWLQSLIYHIGSEKKAAVYLILIYVSFFLHLPIAANWKVNVGGFLIPGIAYFVLWIKGNLQDKMQLLAATALLGTSYFLFKELIRIDPILLIWNEVYQTAFFLILVVMLVVTKLIDRITLLLGGILLGELIFNIRHKDLFTNIVLGNAEVRDILWFSLLQVIAIHYLIVAMKEWIKRKKSIKFLESGE